MRWMVLSMALGLVLVVFGCSRTQRHTFLTIFFEGVPPLKGEETVGESPAATASAKPPRSGAEPGGSPSSLPAKPKRPERQKVVVNFHTPFALRLCDACHPVGRREGGSFANIDLSGTGTTNQPVPALCYGCHADKAPTPEALSEGWMHGPVAAGACTFCHHPHSSRNPFLLLAKPTGKLCQRCHQPGLMHLGEAPQPKRGQDCTACHFGHMGETRFLIKSPPVEDPGQPKFPLRPSGSQLPGKPPPSPTKESKEARPRSAAWPSPVVAEG